MRASPKQVVAIAAITASTLCVAACGGGSPSAQRPDARRLLRFDSATRTARIALLIAYGGSASSLNIDGAFKGALLFAVPRGWRIEIECVNRSATTRWFCAVAPAAGRRSRSRALHVAHPAGGLSPGARTSFAFSAPPGLYRMVALTGGERSLLQPAGMWVVLKVSKGGSPYVRWLR